MTVGLTGTAEFQQKLSAALNAQGITGISLMEGISMPLETALPWDAVAGHWIVFSSVKGVDFFFDRWKTERNDRAVFTGCRFAVIGGETRKAVEARGFSVDICPEAYHSRALAKDLCTAVRPGEQVFLFCSRQGSDYLRQELTKIGTPCLRYETYDTVFRCKADAPAVTYVVFGSAAGVRNLWESGYDLGQAIPVCIGPICAQAVRECYHREPQIAENSTVDALGRLFQRLVLTNTIPAK